MKNNKANQKIREFMAREVYPQKGLKNALAPTGYEAFRVSPRITLKHGKKVRRIYGATVEPDYTRPIKKNKYGHPIISGAKVNWYPHGYTTSGVKAGTRLLGSIKDYPIDQNEAKLKLMIKRKKGLK